MTYDMTRPATYRFNGVGCNTCVVNECSHPAVASFDADGEILMPSGGIAPGMGKYFVNQARPTHSRPIPCAFNVTVAGCESHDINGSWCQTCENLNGSHYTRPYSMNAGIQGTFYGTGQEPWRINTDSRLPNQFKIADIPLCSKQNPISTCGIGNLCVYLMVGPQEGLPENRGSLELINPTYFPSGDAGYIYKYHDPNQDPYIPPRHLYAIAHLEYTPKEGIGIEQCCGENVGFWFKTDLGEWKGDYGGTTITGIPYIQGQDWILGYGYSPHNECIDKYYRGNFDGRELSFTINGSDIVEGGYSWDDSLSYTARLCNFDSMTISVSPADSNYPENITHNSNAPYHPIEYASGEVQYNNEYCSIGSLSTRLKSYGTEWEGLNFSSATDRSGVGLMPQIITCFIDGVVSANPKDPESEDMTIHTCNNCEEINGGHVLEHDSWLWGNYVDSDGWRKVLSPIDNYNDNPNADRTICCNCSTDICISRVEVIISSDSSGTYIAGKIIGTSEDIALAEFRHHFNNGNTELHEDVFDNSFYLLLYEVAEEWQDVCDASQATMTVHFNKSSTPEFNCADPIYNCTYCKDTRPDNIGITIGDFSANDTIPDWMNNCDAGPAGGSYIASSWCYPFLGLTTGGGGCRWKYNNPTDCEPFYCNCGTNWYFDQGCKDAMSRDCYWDEICSRGIYVVEISIFPNFGPEYALGWDYAINDRVWAPPSWNNAMCVHVVAQLYDGSTCLGDGCPLGASNGVIHFGTGFPLSDWGTQIRCLKGEWEEWGWRDGVYVGCSNKEEFSDEHIMGGVYIDCGLLDGLTVPYLGTTASYRCPNYTWTYMFRYNGAAATLSLS